MLNQDEPGPAHDEESLPKEDEMGYMRKRDEIVKSANSNATSMWQDAMLETLLDLRDIGAFIKKGIDDMKAEQHEMAENIDRIRHSLTDEGGDGVLAKLQQIYACIPEDSDIFKAANAVITKSVI